MKPTHFTTSQPVVGPDFFDREEEIEQLVSTVEGLRQGRIQFRSVFGLRRVGKTSLFEELRRRYAADDSVLLVRLDMFETGDGASFFSTYAARVVDEFLAKSGLTAQTGLLSGALADDGDFMTAAARITAGSVAAIDDAVRSVSRIRSRGRGYERDFRSLIDFPERLCTETGKRAVILLDEFQELRQLTRLAEVKRGCGDLAKLLRARWQTHRRVAHFISGSQIRLLQQMTDREEAPFFQHFRPLVVEPFPADVARIFLREAFRGAGIESVPQAVIDELVTVTGGHPFYLQVMGEELADRKDAQKLSTTALRDTLERVLLRVGGRLFIYFAGIYDRLTGDATSLDRVMVALASGQRTVSELAKQIGQSTGSVSSWLARLMQADAVDKADDGGHDIVDPMLALWLRGARSHYRTVAGPYLLGTEAERAVAEQLAREGFRGLYQSRASRGAFDLLAVIESRQVGVQVKRTRTMPYYLRADELQRMRYTARELGWRPFLALVLPDDVIFFDVERFPRARTKSVRVEAAAGCRQLLTALLDED